MLSHPKYYTLLAVVLFTLSAQISHAQSSEGQEQEYQPAEDYHNHHNYYYGTGFGSLAAFIILILDIIAFVEVIQSERTFGKKAFWILLVFFFPLAGLLAYCCCARHDVYREGYHHHHEGYGTYVPVITV